MTKGKFKKNLCISLVLILVFQVLLSLNVSAAVPYYDYFISGTDNFDSILPTPTAYEVKQILDFPDKASGKLSSPEDIFIGPDDKVYIADSGNDRIVVLNPDLTVDFMITGFEEDGSKLKQPSCVFVDDDGTILVCDYGNKRLVEFTKYGNFRFAYPTPASDLLSQDFNYQPQRVVKDEKGYIYVCNLGDSNGILMLSSNGEFRNYFGTNKVALTLWEMIARLLWSREDRKGTVVTLPYTFNNVFISDGYVYATTTGFTSAQCRKINPAGTDVLYSGKDFSDFGLLRNSNDMQDFIDVTVDADQNMFIIDRIYGRVYEYEEWGRNLFAFGANGVGSGQFSNARSLEVDSKGNIYVLNGGNGVINVYAPTDFAKLVHTANKNYSRGIYTAENNPENPSDNAFDQWTQVQREDNFYRLAVQSRGQVLWRLGEYKEAYDLFIEAEDATWVSEAFEELRADFLGEYFSVIATVVVVLLIALVVGTTMLRKYRKKHPADPNSKNVFAVMGRFFKQMVSVSTHPVDGFEDIRYEGKGSYKDAFIIMIVYIVTYFLSLLCTGFIFSNYMKVEWIDWGYELLRCLLPWIVIAITNYGVTTIMYGEGRLRDVIIGGAYCHVPLILTQLPLAIISRVLTLQEKAIYDLIGYIALGWVVLLVYFCIKGVHGFNPLKALVVFFLTAVGVAIVAGLYMIVYGLASQVVDFVVQFAKELSYLV